MLSRMGPRAASFPLRSLSIVSLFAVAAMASGCVSIVRPYGPYGYGSYHPPHGYYGSAGCRAYGSCGSRYTSPDRRYETVYVPVYRAVPPHQDGAAWRGWPRERGWNDGDRRDRDRHRDHGRDRSRDDDRRVGPAPQPAPPLQPQPPQRQRIAAPRGTPSRMPPEHGAKPVENWRSERARRGEPAASPRVREIREALERP